LTDTVGFINHLPTTLIAAFRATLEEIEEANVLLHVLDISHPNAPEQAETVREVLSELEVVGKPMVTALNKIDVLEDEADPAAVAEDLNLPDDFVPISAMQNLGIDTLLLRIEEALGLADGVARVEVCIPYDRSELVNLFHQAGKVEHLSHGDDGTRLSGTLPRRLRERFEPFVLHDQVASAADGSGSGA
jgi:GTP-binding protein HflX